MGFFNRSRRVILVGGEGVVLYAPSARGMGREHAISWDVPDFEGQLVEALTEKNHRKSVLILFDGADQTYRKEENIPKLSPIDRPRFVKRKLELAFPSYPIRASLAIKPPKKKRGGRPVPNMAPSYLFVALPETEQLDRVSTALLEAGSSIAGFGLLPAESSDMVYELSRKVFGSASRSRWSIVIGQHETGGLRQVVVKDGNLALTRLTPTSEAGAGGPGWVEEVLREFKATLTYISRFGYNPDDGLDVIVICGDIEKQFFDPEAMSVANFKCLNPTEVMRSMGVRSFGFETTNYADVVHAAWAAQKFSLRLPVSVPSIRRVRTPRRAANAAGIILTLSTLALAGMTAITYADYLDRQTEIAEKKNRKNMLDREYEAESLEIEKLPIKPQVVKAAMNIKSLLEANTVDVMPYLNRLKSVIGNEMRLEKIVFEHLPSPALPIGRSSGRKGSRNSRSDPEDRGVVNIEFSFALPEAMPLETKVITAEQLTVKLRAAFPNFESIEIDSQFSGIDRQGQIDGQLGEQTEKNRRGTSRDIARIAMRNGEPFPE